MRKSLLISSWRLPLVCVCLMCTTGGCDPRCDGPSDRALTTGGARNTASTQEGSTRRRPRNDVIRSVSQQDIDTLEPGLTLDDVKKRFGAGLPVDSPMLVYSSTDGGLFSFLFLPTNELHVDLPVDEDGPFPIVAVVKARDFPTLLDGAGVYVFPPQIKGKNFTGFKWDD